MTKLKDVNTTDIGDAIELGCQTMSGVFNADDDRKVAFMGSIAWPHAAFSFSAVHSESHIPGRHLNALLNAEDALGISVDPLTVARHTDAAFFSYGGPLPLPMNRNVVGGPLANFCPHNAREGFHALYALVKYRRNDRAEEIAERSIDCILSLWDPTDGWNRGAFEEEHSLEFLECKSLVHGLGRALGPLVKYFDATGSTRALHLATVLKDALIGGFFRPDGCFDIERFGGHVHSVTCCLSSLAQMGETTADLSLLSLVKAFYDKGLWQLRDEIGWSPEDAAQTSTGKTDHGESNNTGDILETALILGRSGYTEYYDDAERILRAHLLPSQLRDVSFIREPENPDARDSLFSMALRHRGAWGFPAPYGHKSINAGRGERISFNMDIVGGVVGSLCEAYREVARFERTGHHVNMFFDCDNSSISVESPYTHDALRIHLHHSGPLFVRIPAWVDREKLLVSDVPCRPLWTGNQLYFPQLPEGITVTFRFPLARQKITLSRNHISPIRISLHGDAVVAMDNYGADFTFFDPM